jgi:dipeptidyl aminopeptidase/acylaminoacyl peptidase
LGEPETIAPTWSKDGSAFTSRRTYHGSTTADVDLPAGRDLQTVIGEAEWWAAFNFDKAAKRLAYFYGQMERPRPDLSCGHAAAGSQLTHQQPALLDEIDLGTVEEVWFKGPDGNDLQGWIIKPPGLTRTRSIPPSWRSTAAR